MNHTAIPVVLVAGASGRTGRDLLRELTDAPFCVRALTRNDANRESLLDHGADEVVIGDLLDSDDAQRAVADCDAVLFAAGSNITTGLTRPSRVVDATGAINLISAAADAGVRRFVFQSSIGVGASRSGMPLWARVLVLRWTVRAKTRAEQALRESGLEYVIFRPGSLTDGPATDDVLLAEGGRTMTGSIPRSDVARLMVDALFTDEALRRTFEIVARDEAKGIEPQALTEIEWQPGVHSRSAPMRSAVR